MALFVFAPTLRPLAGAGVTVITHGFNGNVDDWIIPMADRFTGHPMFPGADFSCYEISVTSGGVSATFLGGTDPALSDSGEILIKLDWSTLSGGGTPTTAIADAAVNALLSTSLIPELGGRAPAELPLHLAGHSRGGSVVTEMARFFGAQGVWVDHVTTWDPRPVGLFGDADTTTWVNVLYADNFWQNLGDGLFVPNGMPVFGAYNRKLTSLGGGYNSSHSDVHLWYHGTVELTTPATDTGATITASQRSSWWTGPEAAGAAAGFHYSLIGGGDRLSAVEPAGSGNGRISDGFNRNWDFGGGVAANRDPLPVNAGLWPNVILCGLAAGTGPVAAGGAFDLAIYHQSGSTGVGTVAVKTFLDLDFNPLTGNEIEIDQRLLANTGTAAVGFSLPSVTVNASQVAPGSYAVFAEISDGVRARCLYAPGLLTVTPSLQPPAIDPDSVEVEGGLMRFGVIGFPGQQVAVMASTNIVDWTPIATHTFAPGAAAWEFADGDTVLFPKRYYRLELLP